MQQPSLDFLLKKVRSKYELVVAVAKRARMLVDSGKLTKDYSHKVVTVALEELAADKIRIERPAKKGGNQ